MVDVLVLLGHKDRVAAVHVVGRGAAQILKDLRQLREAHSPGVPGLPSVHHHKAVVPRLIVTQRSAGVDLLDIVPGVKGFQGLSPVIQQAETKDPSLEDSLLQRRLWVELTGAIGRMSWVVGLLRYTVPLRTSRPLQWLRLKQ